MKSTRHNKGRQSISEPKIKAPALSDEEEIRRRAYQIYLARGGTSGGELDDWLEAELGFKSDSARRSAPESK